MSKLDKSTYLESVIYAPPPRPPPGHSCPRHISASQPGRRLSPPQQKISDNDCLTSCIVTLNRQVIGG